jgi:hypothetical protein
MARSGAIDLPGKLPLGSVHRTVILAVARYRTEPLCRITLRKAGSMDWAG